MFKGILYNALSKYSEVLIAIGITAVLARLLTPAEFGLVALVFVFISFFNLLGNMGIGPAIVQAQDLSKEDLSSIFSFSAVIAVILSLIFFGSSEIISNFYGEPNLIPLVRLLSLSIFFNILSIVPRALISKDLQFKKLGIVSVSIQIITGGMAIWMALEEFSYYSLVWQNILAGFLFFSVFYYMYPIKWVLRINKEPLRRIASFSTFQFATNFLTYFSRNMDSLLIGKFFGNAALGFYNKSYALMQMPVFNLTHVITPVLHPVLAKHQNDINYIYKSYKGIVRILAAIGFPLSVFLHFSAAELILIMFGSQWERSVPVFEVLALSVGLQICLTSVNAIFQATNKTRILFLYGLSSTFFILSGIGYGIFLGGTLESVGWGLVVAFSISFFMGFYLLIVKALGKSLPHFLKIFIAPVISAILAIFVFYLFNENNFENIFLNLLIKSGILGVIIVAFLLLPKENRTLILLIFRGRLKKN